MCATSFIGDTYRDTFPQRWPSVPVVVEPSTQIIQVGIGRDEFEALKREVELLKEMLVAAKKYDEANGEPDCSMEEKVALLRAIAEAVGVDLSEVFG